MATQDQVHLIADLSGGWNSTDPPLDVPLTQVTDADNIEWTARRMPQKRAGATAVSLAPWSPSGTVSALIRHTPQGDETSSELWLCTRTPNALGRYTATGGWTAVSFGDTLQNPIPAKGLSFNGKLFLLIDSNVDRLHVWDGTSVRRVGLATPSAAPTAADEGSGAYAAVARYYRITWLHLSGSTVVRRSERSLSVSFTPSGSGAGVLVTRPAAAGEGETHWEVYGSTDDATYWYLGREAIGTTTFSDTTATTDYASQEVGPDAWTYTVPSSMRYGVVHDSRMVFGRSYESDLYDSRIWWTPVLGTTDEGDDERIPSANYLDIDPGQSGPLKGIGLHMGNPVIWKWSALYKLVSTGDADAPYTVVQLSDSIGCLQHRSIVSAEDEAGEPCVYWLDRRGPYRMGANGIQYLGRDLEGFWADVHLEGRAHAVYYEAKRQVWFFVSTSALATQDPDTCLVFEIRHGRPTADGVRGGWTKWTGSLAAARCSCLWSDSVSTTPSVDLKPHLGMSTGVALWKADSGTTDAGTAYAASFTTAPVPLAGLMRNSAVTGVQVLASADTALLHLELERDFGAETVEAYVDLGAEGDETHVCRMVEELRLTSAQTVSLTVEDDQAMDNTWAVDVLALRHHPEEMR